MVLVDDNSLSIEKNYPFALQIKPFEGEQKDQELLVIFEKCLKFYIWLPFIHQSFIFLLFRTQTIRLQQLLYPFLTHGYPLNLLHHVEWNRYQLDLLCWWSRGFHGLDEGLQGKSQTLFQIHIVFVFLFQKWICSDMIATNSSSFPSCIVPRRISGVELEFSMFIIACKQEGSPKRSRPSDLCIILLDITDIDNNFLNRNTRSILNPMILYRDGHTCAYYLSILMR